MKIGSTVEHVFTAETVLAQYKVYLTYMQNNKVVLERITGDENFNVTGNHVFSYLTQEDTLLFEPNLPVKAQLRWIREDGITGSSNIFTFSAEDSLKQGEIYFVDPSIELDVEALTIGLNSPANVIATITPADALVDWESSNESVAVVEPQSGNNFTGVVTGLTEGSAVITARLHIYPSVYATLNVVVDPNAYSEM